MYILYFKKSSEETMTKFIGFAMAHFANLDISNSFWGSSKKLELRNFSIRPLHARTGNKRGAYGECE